MIVVAADRHRNAHPLKVEKISFGTNALNAVLRKMWKGVDVIAIRRFQCTTFLVWVFMAGAGHWNGRKSFVHTRTQHIRHTYVIKYASRTKHTHALTLLRALLAKKVASWRVFGPLLKQRAWRMVYYIIIGGGATGTHTCVQSTSITIIRNTLQHFIVWSIAERSDVFNMFVCRRVIIGMYSVQ